MKVRKFLPGTTFEKLPDDWTCPDCQEEKQHFIQADFTADESIKESNYVYNKKSS